MDFSPAAVAAPHIVVQMLEVLAEPVAVAKGEIVLMQEGVVLQIVVVAGVVVVPLH